jgi:hypothetical protein
MPAPVLVQWRGLPLHPVIFHTWPPSSVVKYMAALQRHLQAQLRVGVTHTTIGLPPAAADGTVASVRLGSRTVSITYSELVHTGVAADRVPLPVTPDAVTCHPTAGLSLWPSMRAHVTQQAWATGAQATVVLLDSCALHDNPVYKTILLERSENVPSRGWCRL